MNAKFHNGEAEEPFIPNWVYRLVARWKIFLPLAAVLAVVIYLGVHAITYKYESNGFVLLRRDVSLYNAQRPAFYDGALLRRYLASKDKLETPEGQFLLHSVSNAFVTKHLILTMPYGKEDARYVGDKDRSALISTGLDLKLQSRTSGEQAAARMRLLAGFVVDAMLKQTLTSELRNKLVAARSQQQVIDNQLIEANLNLRELTSRLDATRQIAARYPESSRLNDRQLLTTTGDAGRFLSPMAQMIGLESDIAAVKTSLDRLKRQQTQNTVALQFYEGLFAKLPKDPTGEQLLGNFVAAIGHYFGDTSPTDDVRREVYNTQLLMVQSMRSQGLDAPRFTSGPTVPSRMQGPAPLVLLLAAGALATLLATIATLAFDFFALGKHRQQGNTSPVTLPPGISEIPRDLTHEARSA